MLSGMQMQPVYAIEFNHRNAGYMATGQESNIKVSSRGVAFLIVSVFLYAPLHGVALPRSK